MGGSGNLSGRSAISVTGGAKTDVSTTPATVLAAAANREYVEIQNQSNVNIRIGVGEAASTTNGVQVAPGEVWFTHNHAASSISVCSESGSSKTIYMMPASEV